MLRETLVRARSRRINRFVSSLQLDGYLAPRAGWIFQARSSEDAAVAAMLSVVVGTASSHGKQQKKFKLEAAEAIQPLGLHER